MEFSPYEQICLEQYNLDKYFEDNRDHYISKVARTYRAIEAILEIIPNKKRVGEMIASALYLKDKKLTDYLTNNGFPVNASTEAKIKIREFVRKIMYEMEN